MKSITFKQLKRIISEAAKENGIDVDDVTMIDVDDAKSLNRAINKLKQAGVAIESINKVREALKNISFESVLDRAAAKAQESAARAHAGQTKALDDAAKEYAELDIRDNANYFFSVAGKAEEAGNRLGVFIRKTSNPLGGVAAVKYVLKAVEDEKFKKSHADLCAFAEALMVQANLILERMAAAGVVLPPETKWTAELRKLQNSDDKLKQYRAKADAILSEGFGGWLGKTVRGAWDWTVRTFTEFKNWFLDALDSLHIINRKADRAVANFDESLDELIAALNEANSEIESEDDYALIRESHAKHLRHLRRAAHK